MSETPNHHHEPEVPNPTPLAKVIPLQRQPPSYETIELVDYGELASDEVIARFVHAYTHPSHLKLQGNELAEHINKKMTADTSDQTTLSGRLSALHEQAEEALMSDEVYDHKNAHDEVFRDLVTYLQETKKDRGLEDQRKVCLKLLALRAYLGDDATDFDDDWQSIAVRLFS